MTRSLSPLVLLVHLVPTSPGHHQLLDQGVYLQEGVWFTSMWMQKRWASLWTWLQLPELHEYASTKQCCSILRRPLHLRRPLRFQRPLHLRKLLHLTSDESDSSDSYLTDEDSSDIETEIIYPELYDEQNNYEL